MTGFDRPVQTGAVLRRWSPVLVALIVLGGVLVASYVYAGAEEGDKVFTSPPGYYQEPSEEELAALPESFPALTVTDNGTRSQDLTTSLLAAIEQSLPNPVLASVQDALQSLEVWRAQDAESFDGGLIEDVILRTPESHQISVVRNPFYGPIDTTIVFPGSHDEEIPLETWEDGTQAAIRYRPTTHPTQIIFAKGDTMVALTDDGSVALGDSRPWLTVDQLRVIAQAMAAEIPAAPSDGS
ncbi:MAG: hypothetical protein GEU28_09325 [Dehalococcoidia bacterium]|nr:hypothetical protein [Dehalococcoidia bacterium]